MIEPQDTLEFDRARVRWFLSINYDVFQKK